MLTQCQNCGKELTIHILSSHEGWGWEREMLYCAQCVSYQQEEEEYESNAELLCPNCGTHYTDFLKRGYLACASCYIAFALQLEGLIEKYHGITPGKKPFAPVYKVPPLAVARSQELCEYVLAEESIYDLCSQNRELKRDIIPRELLACDSGENKGETKKDIIEGVRLRLARNVKGLPYLGYLSEKQKKDLSQSLLSPQSALALGLGTPNLTLRPAKLETRDEDHLRASWLFAWQGKEHCRKQLFNCLKQIELLDKLYQWQFHPDYGFLTACPALAGHAMRLSFQLRIPALLAKTEVWQSWHENLSHAGYEIRSAVGGESPAPKEGCGADLSRSRSRIQVSNRHWAWGVSPMEGIHRFLLVLESLVEAEYKAGM